MDMESKELKLTVFFRLLNSIRVLHWATDKHSQHVALGKAYDEISEKVDEYVEAYKGAFENVHTRYSDVDMSEFDANNPYEAFDALYKEFENNVDKTDNAHLNSILDDIAVIAYKTRYLLRMA